MKYLHVHTWCYLVVYIHVYICTCVHDVLEYVQDVTKTFIIVRVLLVFSRVKYFLYARFSLYVLQERLLDFTMKCLLDLKDLSKALDPCNSLLYGTVSLGILNMLCMIFCMIKLADFQLWFSFFHFFYLFRTLEMLSLTVSSEWMNMLSSSFGKVKEG